MATFDIILDSDQNFIEKDGDFLTGANDNNLIFYLISANKGNWKEFPLLGAEITKLLNGNENPQEIERRIIEALTSDVFPNPDVDMTEYPPTINVNGVVFDA